MKNISLFEFIQKLQIDFNLTLDKEISLKLPSNKGKIKSFTRSRAKDVRIFDGQKEYPYIINNNIRNETVLNSGIELRCKVSKSLNELISEYNLPLTKSKTRICEGNGWTSSGTKYYYKNFYCEV